MPKIELFERVDVLPHEMAIHPDAVKGSELWSKTFDNVKKQVFDRGLFGVKHKPTTLETFSDSSDQNAADQNEKEIDEFTESLVQAIMPQFSKLLF